MDQNSTNGAGADKRNWRERLGIGAKDMPKLSEEFRAEPQIQAPSAGTAKAAPRTPQPVTRPAPMAPRAPARAPAAPTAAAPTEAAARPTPRLAESNVQDALAEKLRAQRAAAERLAEQRVQAARERAEAKAEWLRRRCGADPCHVPPRAPPRHPARRLQLRPRHRARNSVLPKTRPRRGLNHASRHLYRRVPHSPAASRRVRRLAASGASRPSCAPPRLRVAVRRSRPTVPSTLRPDMRRSRG